MGTWISSNDGNKTLELKSNVKNELSIKLKKELS